MVSYQLICTSAWASYYSPILMKKGSLSSVSIQNVHILGNAIYKYMFDRIHNIFNKKLFRRVVPNLSEQMAYDVYVPVGQ